LSLRRRRLSFIKMEVTQRLVGFKLLLLMPPLPMGRWPTFFDYDDTSPAPVGHPSCTVVPVILALGEKLKLSGKDALIFRGRI